MKSLLVAAAAFALIVASAPADAGKRGGHHGYGKDRGGYSEYGGKRDRKDYGKRDKRGHRADKYGYGGKRGHKGKHDKPEPTPTPTPEPQTAQEPAGPGFSQDTDDNQVFGGSMLHGHPTVNDARWMGRVADGSVSPFDIEKTCEGGCWALKENAQEKQGFMSWRGAVLR